MKLYKRSKIISLQSIETSNSIGHEENPHKFIFQEFRITQIDFRSDFFIFATLPRDLVLSI